LRKFFPSVQFRMQIPLAHHPKRKTAHLGKVRATFFQGIASFPKSSLVPPPSLPGCLCLEMFWCGRGTLGCVLECDP
jgi:hypothetical protein